MTLSFTRTDTAGDERRITGIIITVEKPVPCHYIHTQGLAWDRTRSFAVIDRTLTVCTMAQSCINLLKPTGYVMHQQFNIQQLYALPTLYLCVLYLSENKQRLVPLTA